MQNELLDILIIGCLVLLFASTYSKRGTFLVRCWSIGWLLILVHFAVQLLHPVQVFAQNLISVISIGGLIACAVLFLLPTGRKEEPRTLRNLALPLLPALTSVATVTLIVWNVNTILPHYVLVAAGEFGALVYAIRFHRDRKRVLVLLVLSVLSCSCWMLWTISHGRLDICISAILTQFYLTVAIVYMDEFRRISGGMLTVAVGLFAWAAVFPVAEFCAHLGVVDRISGEVWNVPKYFVAFGMILVLLEEEIIAANAASRNYRMLFEANPHPMWIYDRETLAFHSVNDAAVAQYGYSREEFMKMTLVDLRPTEDFDKMVQELRQAEPTQQLTGPWKHQKADGSLIQVDIATQQMHTDGRSLAFCLMQDVTERQKLHEQLVHQANHDILTGIPNRALLEDRMRQTLAHAKRHGRHAALLCLDVDRFKQINDTHGHNAGDICLKEIARRLSGRVRGIDTVARAGGEEFSVLLHEIDSVQDAQKVAADILSVLNEPIQVESYTVELTASIGIAVYPWDGHDAETLWRNADWAMYRAKNAGGNQYLCMSKEISLIVKETNELELFMRHALREGGFELYYQPMYDMQGGLCSLEALIRLRYPKHGIILPGRFIPIAEESGLIVPIGNWVLEEVCRQSSAWQSEGLLPVRIALNVSPLQLTRFDFSTHVMDVLAKYEVSPSLVGMEVTETSVMRNIADATRQITILARMGIDFSVDDFGTGYSSLAHLHKLPVQTLKIDRSFIERIAEPNGTYAIVQAIVFLAHSLKMKVVAEGVEREDQLECLRQLDCDIIQGYLFSQPLPAAEIATLLRANQVARPGHVAEVESQIQLTPQMRLA
jgi:diguanylate cyclase (GGDEF)-like protein/PAS domain S-box-containing protein